MNYLLNDSQLFIITKLPKSHISSGTLEKYSLTLIVPCSSIHPLICLYLNAIVLVTTSPPDEMSIPFLDLELIHAVLSSSSNSL